MSFKDLTENLHAKSVELNEHLTNLKQLNETLIATSAGVLESLSNLVGTVAIREPRVTCNVCYSRPPTHALSPCGHAGLCLNCAERAKTRNRCHVCRGRVVELLKIYI